MYSPAFSSNWAGVPQISHFMEFSPLCSNGCWVSTQTSFRLILVDWQRLRHNNPQLAKKSKQKRRAFARRFVSMDARVKPAHDDI
jgi:hypothetical protein